MNENKFCIKFCIKMKIIIISRNASNWPRQICNVESSSSNGEIVEILTELTPPLSDNAPAGQVATFRTYIPRITNISFASIDSMSNVSLFFLKIFLIFFLSFARYYKI